VFDVKEVGDNFVDFLLTSPDGDMGFPGTCTTSVKFSLVDDECRITMAATMSESDCPVSLANHAYWNLAGHSAGE